MGLYGKKCSLCGGKLDSNRVCTECGLDNSKSDENYVSTGDAHKNSKALTHVHTEYDSMKGKTVTKDTVKKSSTNTYKTNPSRTAGGTRKKKSKAAFIIAAIVLIVNILPMFLNIVGDIFGGIRTPEYEYIESEAERDPYTKVTRELSPEGMSYEAELTAGMYKGGVHIPEGTYEVVFIPEEGNEDSDAILRIMDDENSIYQQFYFGDEGYDVVDDFRVYTGGLIIIDGRGTLLFGSANAQSQDMRSEENPNTQRYNLRDFSDTGFEVGTDIAPGVYDVVCESGSGVFDYEVTVFGEFGPFQAYCGMSMGQEAGFASELKNIVLPAGTMVYIDGLSVTLVPSEKIESEEYESYYDNW